MEIIIFKKFHNSKSYIYEYTDNSNIQCLGTFLYEIFPWSIEDLISNLKKRNIIFSSTLSSSMYLYDETIEICSDNDRTLLDRQLDELPDFDKVSRFVINVDRFIEILEKWKEMLIKQPTFIILKISDTEIIFEEDYREEIALEASKAKTTEKSIENIFNLKTENGLFYGGFHLLDNKMNIKNSSPNSENVLSIDFEVENDFTFNHALLSNKYNKEEIIEEITKNEFPYLYAIKCHNQKDENLFCDYAVSYKDKQETGTIIRVLYDKEMKIITAYPIFRRTK
jgi:hypothetical protein